MLEQKFRNLMASVCAPVTVVTTMDADGPHGATVSSLASLSLRPSMVSIALDRGSALLARIQRSGRFGINVLNAGQDGVAMRFARRGEDRFADVSWSVCQDLPQLGGLVAWAVCELHQVVVAGDHLLLIGLVTHAESTSEPPLVYAQRKFGTHSELVASSSRSAIDDLATCAR